MVKKLVVFTPAYFKGIQPFETKLLVNTRQEFSSYQRRRQITYGYLRVV